MKIHVRIRRHQSPKAQRPIRLPPRTVSDDPAFSADPHTHPYHYLAGHPTLQGWRRRRRSKIHPNHSQGDSESEFELIQPPNSPALRDSENNNENTQPFPLPVASCLPKDPSLTAASMVPSPAKDPKPVERFGFLTRRKTKQGQDPLIKENSGPPQPQLQRHRSAPDPGGVRLAQGDVAQAVSSTADINQHTASDVRFQAKQRLNLDIVGELDKTRLSGPLHRDGPYEAIRAVVGSQARMPLGLSDNGRLHQYHDRTMQAVGHVYMPPEVPAGVPLNLSPGQVLPRNFRRQAGKPPRLRNNMVAPLPLEEIETAIPDPVTAPRHARFNEIPFHKGYRKAKQRPNPDNPLDGPPIDPFLTIGLAMMNFQSSTDDDDTPQPVAQVQQQYEPVDVEYDPYAPENIEDKTFIKARSPSPSPELESRSTTPRMLDGPELVVPSDPNLDLSPRVEVIDPCSRSPSPSSHLDLPTQGIHSGASEETLVQKEDEADSPVEVSFPPIQDASATKLEAILMAKVEHPVSSQYHAQADANEGSPNLTAASPNPINFPVAQTLSQNTPSPQPFVAGEYDKQLPHPPSNTPPLPNPSDQAPVGVSSDSQQPAVNLSPEGRERKTSAPPVALQRSDPRATNKSSGSYQSHSSTKGEHGHIPVANILGIPSSNVAPQIMSQQNPDIKSSTLLLSRRDPIFNADSLTQYPLLKPPLLPNPVTQDRKPRSNPPQRPLQRANSTSSSKKSLQLSPIQEDAQLPLSISKRAEDMLVTFPGPSQVSRSDSRLTQGLHRSQSLVQPRLKEGQVQIGQVYPLHLQGPPLQRSTSRLVPQGRPPSYSEEPQSKQPPPPQKQYHQLMQQQQQQKMRTQVQTQIDAELPRQNSVDPRLRGPLPMHRPQIISPPTQPQAPLPTPRIFSDDRHAQHAVNTLSGVPQMDESHGFVQSSRELGVRERSYRRDFRPQGYAQQYPSRDNASFVPHSIKSNTTSSTAARFQPHHIPKKLVMPAPLQQNNQPPRKMPQAQHYNDIFGPRPTPSNKSYHPGQAPMAIPHAHVVSRELTPPNILPPLLSNHNTRPDPSSVGRKLKKRTGHNVHPPPPTRSDIFPNTALDFEPVIITPPPNEKPTPRPKPIPEKAAKRVLSKRRTNP